MKALITGGAGVFGREICFFFHNKGYEIHVLDARDISELDTELQNIINNYLQVDLSSPEEVDELFKDERLAKQDYDVLIINAFPRLFGQFSDYSTDELQKIVYSSFTGQLLLVNRVLQNMLLLNNGQIMIIGSKAALFGYSRGSLYCSMKAAWRAWYESVSRELKTMNRNISVSLIHPDSFSLADGRKLKGFNKITKLCLQSIEKGLINTSKEYYAIHFKTRVILTLRILLNAIKILFK